MKFIDSHTHIDFDDFNTDRDIIIQNSLDKGVTDIIVSATIEKQWSNINELCNRYSSCHASYGLHPMFMDDHDLISVNNDLHKLESYLSTNKAVAVSEIGLDFFIDEADADNQKAQLELFIAQCEIAQDHKLPVIIHARKSLDIILKHLRSFKDLQGSIHCFSGSEQQARQFIDLGFYLSFGGPITYDRATKLHRIVKNIPIRAFLIETDSPDQPDVGHRGMRNEPAFILNIAEKVAELKNIDVELVAAETRRNAIDLFNLNPT